VANALIALGGNVGDVAATFREAIPAICEAVHGRLLARSSDYLTPPWGDLDQAAFINACIEIETPFGPHDLLAGLQKVERAFGRDRANERHWGPRTLDLDILAMDDLEISDESLTLPHPRIFERAFVLVPLAEIAPDRRIGGRTASEALLHIATDGITLIRSNAL
jgi:2-amino-4-hydroxy-6-hydroxymethyldihydropteridine diphosphokinase